MELQRHPGSVFACALSLFPSAQLAEQERAARELQRQLEEEEQQAMAEIRAAQERDASIPARAPAPAKPAPKPQPAHAEVQRRLSLDVDTWGLVLQVRCSFIFPAFSTFETSKLRW